MTIHQSVLELIGRTPMVKAQRLDTGADTMEQARTVIETGLAALR